MITSDITMLDGLFIYTGDTATPVTFDGCTTTADPWHIIQYWDEPWEPTIIIDQKKKNELYLNALPGKKPRSPEPLKTRQPYINFKIFQPVRYQRE